MQNRLDRRHCDIRFDTMATAVVGGGLWIVSAKRRG